MNLPPLTVVSRSGTYPVIVGAGMLQELPARLKALGSYGTVWLISDTEVYPRYGTVLEAQLRDSDYTVRSRVVPAGETSKEFQVVMELYDWMLEGGVERRDVVLALGGGVVGDLAGFIAATILRGIALIQLPTTLLAMVDSAIGGKTGVNHRRGKNLIGAFYPPCLVLSDTTTLASLPMRERSAGWAETIKHGVIRDKGLFELLEKHTQVLTGQAGISGKDATHSAEIISTVIHRSAAVKVKIVSADEREHGERMLLNYGHTLGHALEVATGYGTLLHGEAVAIGMHLAAQIAHRLELCGPELVVRQQRLLHAYGLDIPFPAGLDPSQLVELTLRDKKVRERRVRWVLPTEIGAATVCDDVPEQIVQAVVEATAVS